MRCRLWRTSWWWGGDMNDSCGATFSSFILHLLVFPFLIWRTNWSFILWVDVIHTMIRVCQYVYRIYSTFKYRWSESEYSIEIERFDFIISRLFIRREKWVFRVNIFRLNFQLRFVLCHYSCNYKENFCIFFCIALS